MCRAFRTHLRICCISLVLTLVLFSPIRAGEAPGDQKPLRFSLTDTYGRRVSSDDYKGVPVLVEFGACWCGGCQGEAAKLGRIAADFRPRGLAVLHAVAGDNELGSLEYQKHYRLNIVNVLDSNREFEKTYNRDGWPFVIVADRSGNVVYAAGGLQDSASLESLLGKVLTRAPAAGVKTLEGIPYMPATLKRSGESDKPRLRERFPSVACGPDGRVYLAFTSNRNGNDDVFARVFDGKVWSEDHPVAATKADEYDVTVAVDEKNRAWFSWTSNADGKNYNIFVACVADFTQIVKSEQVTRAGDDAMHGRLACGPDGTVWLTYYKWGFEQGTSRDREIYLRRFNGKSWSGEIQVSPTDVPSYEDHADPRVAAKGRSAIVCWSWDFHQPKGYPPDARDPTIFIRSVGPDLKLDAARVLSGKNIDTMPALALDDGGAPWCAWESIAWSSRLRTYAKSLCVSRADGPGGAGTALSGGLQNVCTPCLVRAPGGLLTAVWAENQTGTQWLLKRADLDPKTKRWTAVKTLVADGNPRFPSIACDAKGSLWVAYSRETTAGREIAVENFPLRQE